MSAAGFLRIKKLKGSNTITVAARHNQREIPVPDERHDPARLHLNETRQGPPTAAGVAQLAKDLMSRAGVVKFRKDGVMGLEFLFSLPPDHQLDDRAYFDDCTAWVAAQYGGADNILSVDIHRDEGAPHCHILLLPLVNGKMSGSDLMGGPQKLAATHKHFHEAVAARHGLRRAPAKLTVTSKQAGAAAVLAMLKSRSDSALRSTAWATIRDSIESNPGPWLLALGIEIDVAKKPMRNFTQIMISKGKGPAQEVNPIGFDAPAAQNPIGFDATPEERTLSCVGFARKQLTADEPAAPEQLMPTGMPKSMQSQPSTKAGHADNDEWLRQSRTGVKTMTKSAVMPDSEQHAPSTPDALDATKSTDVGDMREGYSATRQRDSDLKTGQWCERTGEFLREPAAPSRHQRDAANEWVYRATAEKAERLGTTRQ